MAVTKNAGIALWMNVNVKFNVANPKPLRTLQKPSQTLLRILVCREHYQVQNTPQLLVKYSRCE